MPTHCLLWWATIITFINWSHAFLRRCRLQLCRHGLPVRICLSVRPSVCLCVKCMKCDKANEFCWHSYTIWKVSSSSCKVFTGLSSHAQIVDGGCPLLSEISHQSAPLFSNGDFQSIFTCSLSVIKPSEKIQLENEAVANALQLEAAQRRAVRIHFNSSPMPSLNSLSLSLCFLRAFLLLIRWV